MSGRPQGPDRGGDLITRLLVRMVADRRDREELQTSFDELRRRGHHGRLWYWREVLRTVWALRADPNWSTRPGRSLLESTWADLRWSVRLLWRSPDVTLVAVPTLALAVGATTALFSFADALLLRPLAVDEPDRLIALHHATTGEKQRIHRAELIGGTASRQVRQ